MLLATLATPGVGVVTGGSALLSAARSPVADNVDLVRAPPARGSALARHAFLQYPTAPRCDRVCKQPGKQRGRASE